MDGNDRSGVETVPGTPTSARQEDDGLQHRTHGPRAEEASADRFAGRPSYSNRTAAGGSSETLRSGSGLWKAATAVSFLLAAGLALVVLMERVPMAVPVAALLPVGSPDAAFVMEARPNGGLEVLPLHPNKVPRGHVLELWLVPPGGGAPEPIGMLPLTGLRLRGETLPRGTARIQVTLEPEGATAGDRSVGPVLYSGTLLVPR